MKAIHHSVLSGKKTYILVRTMHGILPKVGISCNQGTRPFCHVLCLGMHTNVMLRFMVQALQDPPSCSSTSCTFIANHFLYIKLIIMICCFPISFQSGELLFDRFAESTEAM
jgi:hypothetical protein